MNMTNDTAHTTTNAADAYALGLVDAVRVVTGYDCLTTPWHMEAQTAEVQAAYWAARNGQPVPPTPGTSSRTWKVTIPVMLEGAWQMTLTHTVTAFRIGNQIVGALVDGAEATLERAANLLTWAKREGTLEVLETVDAAQPATLSKRTAQALHLDLSRLGYTHSAHYEVASAAVGRDLVSLTELTR